MTDPRTPDAILTDEAVAAIAEDMAEAGLSFSGHLIQRSHEALREQVRVLTDRVSELEDARRTMSKTLWAQFERPVAE